MCNYCNCSNDAYDRCSMLGHMLEGFCCELCVGYENRHECEHYGLKFMTKVIPNSQHISISSNSEAKPQEKEEKVTLIVNKDR